MSTLSISQIASQLIGIAKADVAQDILPAAATFFNSLAANPSKLNLAVQVAVLEGAVLQALPKIETDELKALATVLTTEASAALSASASTPATAAAAKPA